MSVTRDLSPEQEAILREQAKSHGLTLEHWRRILERGKMPQTSEENEPEMFWEMVLRNFADVPKECFEKLPRDGASEHDHYIYGTPKKNW